LCGIRFVHKGALSSRVLPLLKQRLKEFVEAAAVNSAS
jgi:hypothetical protein